MTSYVPLAPAEQSHNIQRELQQCALLLQVRGLDVYTLKAEQAPATMNEIGRIRESVFRDAGAGRNLARDIDDLDFGTTSYIQLVVWDPKRLQLVALYRYKPGFEAVDNLQTLRTSQLFDYSDAFTHKILPHSIELGRSVVNGEAGAARFGFFALWAGLNALLAKHPQVDYFFGNVSLYKNLGKQALDIIISFCQQLYPPPEPLLRAKSELCYQVTSQHHFENAKGLDSRARIQQLETLLAAQQVRIPKILQSYLSLGTHIWFDDAAADGDFGDAFELSIVVPVSMIDPQRRQQLTSNKGA